MTHENAKVYKGPHELYPSSLPKNKKTVSLNIYYIYTT